MNKQEWIAEFAKEFQAKTQMRYKACFDVADSVYEDCEEYSEMTPDEAVQEELSHWYG